MPLEHEDFYDRWLYRRINVACCTQGSWNLWTVFTQDHLADFAWALPYSAFYASKIENRAPTARKRASFDGALAIEEQKQIETFVCWRKLRCA